MKPFVAAATLQLVEEGRFGLDDPLPAVLPPRVLARFPDADRITVRMLLNHTSGIGEYSDDGLRPRGRRRTRAGAGGGELLDRGAALPRAGAPGERFAYSNATTTCSAWSSSTRPASHGGRCPRARHRAAASRAHVAARAGHYAGRKRHRPRVPAVDGRSATSRHRLLDGRRGRRQRPADHAEDLSRFLRALLGGRLFERRQTLRRDAHLRAPPDEHGRAGYGLGLERYVLPGGVEMIGHMGTAGGYRALMFHLPDAAHRPHMVTNQPGDPMPVLFPALELLLNER